MVEQLSPSFPILIVDDNVVNLKLIDLQLRNAGLNNLLLCEDSRQVSRLLEHNAPDIALIDLKMPYVSGEELLAKMQQNHPDIPVIIVTASTDVKTAVQCMKAGAFDYVVKPFDRDLLLAAVNRALAYRELQKENRALRQRSTRLKHPEVFKKIITNNRKMMEIFTSIEAIAPTSWPVLVTGETGVGKEMISHVIHEISGRHGPLVSVNVAGLDDNMFSDTIFGHVKGAFTGADRNKKGLIVQAAKGTLFLDEIGDLSHMSQVKLLRLIQEKEYFALGDEQPKKTDARIITATNRNLWELQKEGRFREDLHYRLRTHHIHIPPLRERINDIELLVDYFLEISAKEQKKKKPTVPRELFTLLSNYSFPGNIRELQGMVFDALSRHKSRLLSLDVFKVHIKPNLEEQPLVENLSDTELVTFHEKLPTLKQASHLLIMEALKRSNNNQSIAASMLGVTQQALSKRIKNIRDQENLV